MRLRITIAGNTYEAEVEVLEDEETSAPYVPPPVPAYMAADNSAQNVVSTFDKDSSGRICRSPVTGLVIRVLAQPGQAVQAGQLLLVLEAMKMETQVTAPHSGTVQKVHVEPGNSVRVNQPLVELEWETTPLQERVK